MRNAKSQGQRTGQEQTLGRTGGESIAGGERRRRQGAQRAVTCTRRAAARVVHRGRASEIPRTWESGKKIPLPAHAQQFKLISGDLVGWKLGPDSLAVGEAWNWMCLELENGTRLGRENRTSRHRRNVRGSRRSHENR